jgi:hypothetical protein
VVALLAVGACDGGGDDPPVRTTSTGATSASSTGSPSTTTTAPATVDQASLPPEARKHTPEGAAAFVKYYIGQTNEAWTKPDVRVLPPLVQADCLSCQAIQDVALELDAKGRHYVSDPVTVTEVVPLDGAPGGRQRVRVQLQQHEVDVVDSAGKVVSTDPAQELARTVDLVWKEASWLVFGIA